MELDATELGNVPTRYSMHMSKNIVPMSVFSESTQGKICAEGKICNKFEMKPHNETMDSYGKLCRERTNKCMTRARQTQVLDNYKGTHMRPMPRMIVTMDKKKTAAKASKMKRTRRDRGEMEEIMFKFFERQQNWTLKQLIQDTDQPEQFLKDILKDLCVYNNKGANQAKTHSNRTNCLYRHLCNSNNVLMWYQSSGVKASLLRRIEDVVHR